MEKIINVLDFDMCNAHRVVTFVLLLIITHTCLLVVFARYISYTSVKYFVYITFPCCTILMTFSAIIFNYMDLTALATYGTWLEISGFTVDFSFLYDRLSINMGWLVVVISCLVHLFALDYLKNDPHTIRFFIYLALFTEAMLVFVFAGNFVIMFVGWEGIGMCSYLLINFWFTRVAANKAALKALIMNKIGDIFMLIGLAIIAYITKTTDYLSLNLIIPEMLAQNTPTAIKNSIEIAAYLLTLACFVKSAQIGFHTWLADAMEGPTPVSALLHAATMVTAGVYLYIRIFFLMSSFPNILALVTIVGTLTAVFASITATFQTDIKKLIAYSTCNHLGFMFTACGLGVPSLAFYHTINHGFFKALLFLISGCVIHALRDQQDMRRMGGLAKQMPLTFLQALIASLSSIGMPYLAGNFSKDVIVEISSISVVIPTKAVFIMLNIAAFFSAAYTVRLIVNVFLGTPRHGGNYNQMEGNYTMHFALAALTLLSIFSGYLFVHIFSDLTANSFGKNISDLNSHLPDVDNIPNLYRWLTLVVIFSGAFFGFFLDSAISKLFLKSLKHGKLTRGTIIMQKISDFFANAAYIDYLYNCAAQYFLKFTNSWYQIMDKGILEYLGPYGIFRISEEISKFLKILQNGNVYVTIGMVVTSILVIVVLLTLIIF